MGYGSPHTMRAPVIKFTLTIIAIITIMFGLFKIINSFG
jgi:hypothetical protein